MLSRRVSNNTSFFPQIVRDIVDSVYFSSMLFVYRCYSRENNTHKSFMHSIPKLSYQDSVEFLVEMEC